MVDFLLWGPQAHWDSVVPAGLGSVGLCVTLGTVATLASSVVAPCQTLEPLERPGVQAIAQWPWLGGCGWGLGPYGVGKPWKGALASSPQPFLLWCGTFPGPRKSEQAGNGESCTLVLDGGRGCRPVTRIRASTPTPPPGSM